MLHRFEGLFSRQLVPMVLGGGPFAAGSKLMFAEAAVYVRVLDRLAALPPARLPAFARLAHDIYRSLDLAGQLLAARDRVAGMRLLWVYVDGMNASAG